MDLESECSVLESSVEDNNEEINETEVQSNVLYVVGNNDNNELLLLANLKPDVSSPSPTTTVKKGYGLKKWRRIRRESNKGFGESSVDSGKKMVHELSNSDRGLSKRTHYADRNQKSEGSVSSMNAVVRNFDGSPLLDDSGLELGLGLGPPVSAGSDSENSEDRSSNSKNSTAASAPKVKYERPVVVEFSSDRGLSGKNMTVQQGKGRVETSKKARGEQRRVKIEKENSHSSLESDSRSSNFVFMQGTYSTNNGIRNDGDDGDEDGSGEQGVTDGHRLSPEDDVADSSWEVKEERSENHGSSSDQDPLVESLFNLESAKEALEKELLNFQEISYDILVDESVSDLGTEFIDDEQKTRYNQFPGEGEQSFSRTAQSEVVEKGNTDVETETEDLFKQKIEAEVEYIAISRTVQKLRTESVSASEQTQILDKLGVAENKAALLKKEAEKLETICEDIASADEIMKLQKRVCKYSSCFFVQLVLLVVILGVFMFHLSSSYVEVVPT